MISFLLISTFLLTANLQQPPQDPPKPMNLLMLKSHWGANGVGHLLPNRMKILTSRLKNQISSFYSYQFIQAGSSWQLDYTLKYNCSQPSKDFGVSLSFSTSIRKTNRQNYSFSNYQPMFGMNSVLDGIVILHTNNQVNMGLFVNIQATRDDLLFRTKPCKVFPDADGQVFMRVKQNVQGVFGIYNINSQNSEERLCIQYNDVRLNKFFMGITGSDEDGQCGTELNNLTLYPTEQYQVVDPSVKQVGDNNFAFFA